MQVAEVAGVELGFVADVDRVTALQPEAALCGTLAEGGAAGVASVAGEFGLLAPPPVAGVEAAAIDLLAALLFCLTEVVGLEAVLGFV